LIQIRIQHFSLNTDWDPDPIWIQVFYDQKLEKSYSRKKSKTFFGSNYNLPIPWPL
jgi:hypothetical protein